MSHTRTQRHTKLAQYVIQPKNTVRSRHFAPRMRVSKGIKDSKASFARRAQNGQPRSSFSLLSFYYASPRDSLAPPLISSARSFYLSLYLAVFSFPPFFSREGIERALKTRRFQASVACTRPHSKGTEIRTNRCTMHGAPFNAHGVCLSIFA